MRFLLKHSVLPEANLALERSLAVADLACVELPATWHASQALGSDTFGRLCGEMFGSTRTDGKPVERVVDQGWQIDHGTKALQDYLPERLLATLRFTRAEVSCRRVVEIVPPSSDEPGLSGSLGILVLAPWGGPFSQDIPLPQMAFDSSAEPSLTDEEIRVFVDPGVLRDVLVGLGLHGTWAFVGPEKPEEDDNGAAGDLKHSGSHTGWWYVENVTGAFPSYWENDEYEEWGW